MAHANVVFVADKLTEDALRVLRNAGGIEVDYRPGLPLDEKAAAVARARALIVRSATKVTASLLEAADQLELIVRAGVGVDNIDIEAATHKGIVVQNVPEGNIRSAAEHSVALILALARHVPQANLSMKEGRWERSDFLGIEIQGKKLGIVGLGKIGRHVTQMARGLGFTVLAFDPFIAPRMADDLKVTLVSSLEELVSQVDFLTIHVPATADTESLIDAEVLSHAKRGLRVINCARGGIVDESALLDALNKGRVDAAALDVFRDEPPGLTPLIQHPRVIVTPHLGASTREAQLNVAIGAANQVVDYLLEGKLHSPVNTVQLEPDLRAGLEPYRDLAVKLGCLQAQLLQGNPMRIVVKYFGDLFTEAIQSFLTNSVLEGFLRAHSAQPVNFVNARALAAEQGLAVEGSAEGKSRYFAQLIRVEITDSTGAREVGGTIRGRSGLRLVSLNSYYFDAVLEGNVILSANEDRPGMIGVIGSLLASHKLNISNMSLGRDKTGGTAMAVVNVDEPVPDEVIQDLARREGILWARVVRVD